MEIAKITSKGQITIPISVRQNMGLKEGGKVLFFEDETGYRIVNAALIALQEAQKEFAGEAERLGLQDEDDVVAMIKDVRKQRRQEKQS